MQWLKNAFHNLVTVFMVVGVICLLGMAVFAFNSTTCQLQASGTGYTVKYRPMAGCLVAQPDGHWLPWKNMRGTP